MQKSELHVQKWRLDLGALICFALVLHSPRGEVGGKRVSQEENQEFQCSENIESHTQRNGTISSPFHPGAYPAGIICRYNFTGVGRERIQLRFLHIDLHCPTGNAAMPKDCENSDSVTVYIIINGNMEKIGTWCGGKLPPMLMSNQPKMIVEFRSYLSSPKVTGFKAQYSFVTNFGIYGGQQDNRGTCAFNYLSSVKSFGEITSPNYNGLYPRNTECHYLFYGRGKERVQINFTYFEVDGLKPNCEESTKSDYVSFSNFAESEDRKMNRLCGHPQQDKQEIWSDGPFFRVTFKSNDIYDSMGFRATYQFKGFDDDKYGKNSHSASDRGAGTYEVQDQKRNSANSDHNLLSDWKSQTGYLPLTPLTSLTVLCVIAMLFFLPPRIF